MSYEQFKVAPCSLDRRVMFSDWERLTFTIETRKFRLFGSTPSSILTSNRSGEPSFAQDLSNPSAQQDQTMSCSAPPGPENANGNSTQKGNHDKMKKFEYTGFLYWILSFAAALVIITVVHDLFDGPYDSIFTFAILIFTSLITIRRGWWARFDSWLIVIMKRDWWLTFCANQFSNQEIAKSIVHTDCE